MADVIMRAYQSLDGVLVRGANYLATSWENVTGKTRTNLANTLIANAILAESASLMVDQTQGTFAPTYQSILNAAILTCTGRVTQLANCLHAHQESLPTRLEVRPSIAERTVSLQRMSFLFAGASLSALTFAVHSYLEEPGRELNVLANASLALGTAAHALSYYCMRPLQKNL